MSQCFLCENSLETYCKECQESYCHHCGILKHLCDGSIQPHIINYLCEECEDEVSTRYCKSCEQNLCPNCDTKIHNKGKRAQHTRDPISDCLCMKDIKIVAHLTLPFLKDHCEIEETQAFSEQLDQMVEQILKTQKDHDKQNIIFISTIDSTSEVLLKEDKEKLIESLKQIKVKNFLLFENGDNEEDFSSFKQNLAKDKNLNDKSERIQTTIKGAYIIYQILKNVQDVESIYVFDTYRNESFVRTLQLAPTLETKKFYLNFDPSNPEPFEISPYSVTRSKKSLIDDVKETQPILPSIVPEIQLGSSAAQKSKPNSEPFVPQVLLEIHQLNSTSHNEYGLHKDNHYEEQAILSRLDYKKVNESYDDILQNLSSDQILQKRNPPFVNVYHQYPYMTQNISQRRQNILTEQPLKNIEVNGSLKLSHFLQQELRKFANQGELLIMRDELVTKLAKTIHAKYNCKLEDVLKQAEEVKIIHTTIRKFLETQPLFYFGILLDTLTIESLTWVVRSIKNDLMTPTEKLILSRVKECYGLKVDQNFWKLMLNYISSNQTLKQTKANSFEHANIFPLNTRKILDPVTNTDTFVIFLTTEEWTPEDQGTIEENTEEWREFLQFIENFFREDDNSIDQKSTSFRSSNQEAKDQIKKAIWSSSVENTLNRSMNKKDKSLKISDDVKAIPGGRYGCAQFIKVCGPELLKKLSIGRLTLFVQEAINKGILRYQRTLLVKNNPNDSVMSTLTEDEGRNTSFSQDPTTERKTKILKTVKDVLIEILSETSEGVPLAQIPLHLKRKMDYAVNFQELGFPKLKNFLATLPDLVKIESSGTNHAFVKLKNPITSNSRKNLTLKDQVFLPKGQDPMQNSYNVMGPQNQVFQPSPPAANLTAYNQPNYDSLRYSYPGNQNFLNSTPSSDAKNPKGRKKVSTLDDYLNKVKGLIELILTDNCYGISMQKLYQELTNKLTFDFDFRMFNCSTFDEFLMNYADNLLDIEIKKNFLIIYPKNFRFGPQTLVNQVNTEQQRNSAKSTDLYDSGLESKRGYNLNQLNPTASPFLHGDKSGRNSTDFGAPPGLVKPSLKQPLSPFGIPYNNQGFGSNFSQPKQSVKRNDNGTSTQNFSNLLPNALYGYEESDAMSEKYMQEQSLSYWKTDLFSNNLNFEEGKQGITSISHLNTGLHSRADSRGFKMQVQEESNLEIRENLKFIEELLQDNDYNEKSIMTNFTLDRTNESSFGGIQSPNLSFTGLTAIGPQGNITLKQNHSKTQSEDFTNKNVLRFPGGHGRVVSAIPERKNEQIDNLKF